MIPVEVYVYAYISVGVCCILIADTVRGLLVSEAVALVLFWPIVIVFTGLSGLGQLFHTWRLKMLRKDGHDR